MPSPTVSNSARTAIVLSGGGVRGAYEVGVLRGLMEILGLQRDETPPFSIFAGTSVGAINAAYLAANTHRGDLNIEGLAEVWRKLDLARHLKLHPWGLLPQLLRRGRRTAKVVHRSIMDTSALEDHVYQAIDWERLHKNVGVGTTHALLVPALDASSGRTVVFAELADTALFVPSPDPRRMASIEPIGIDHLMASAAIPFLFPARRIGTRFFFDGGLRFNTPIAPAIRSGATRLVVISLLQNDISPQRQPDGEEPTLMFLVGKVLNALLLDPVVYDLQILDRFNQLWALLDHVLDPEAHEALQDLVVASRGVPYRQLQTLDLKPSRDIGDLAGAFVRERLDLGKVDWKARWLLRRAIDSGDLEADWVAYFLFEGAFADELITLGHQDAHAQADKIRAFFAAPEALRKADQNEVTS